LLSAPVPVTGVTGDSQGSLFGQLCLRPGSAKATFGTGTSVVMNIGDRALPPAGGLVTSVAWSLSDTARYVYEGNIHCSGDTVKWLVEGLGLIPDSASSERIALSVEDNNGVYLVPAFVGLGAPHWDSEARASITGMARNTTKGHIVRAALESIAYQIKDLIDVMTARSGIELTELRVDGGASRNELLMQFQADMLDVPVVRSEVEEVSALGSVYMAGMTVGLWTGLSEIEALPRKSDTFRCRMASNDRASLYRGWKRALERTVYRPSP
jgi:glycerol kinase